MLSREEQYIELDLECVILLSSAAFMVLHTIMLIVAACVTKAGSKLLESVYRVVPAYMYVGVKTWDCRNVI
jgi:hypothetical protein